MLQVCTHGIKMEPLLSTVHELHFRLHDDRALQAGHNIAHLDLGGGKVTSIGAQMLAAVCHKGKLRHLSLRGSCMIGSEGIASFSRSLVQKSCHLEALDLADCEAGDEAAVAFASALMEGRQIQRDSSLPSKGQPGPLRQLDLSSNQITIKGKCVCNDEMYDKD